MVARPSASIQYTFGWKITRGWALWKIRTSIPHVSTSSRASLLVPLRSTPNTRRRVQPRLFCSSNVAFTRCTPARDVNAEMKVILLHVLSGAASCSIILPSGTVGWMIRLNFNCFPLFWLTIIHWDPPPRLALLCFGLGTVVLRSRDRSQQHHSTTLRCFP